MIPCAWLISYDQIQLRSWHDGSLTGGLSCSLSVFVQQSGRDHLLFFILASAWQYHYYYYYNIYYGFLFYCSACQCHIKNIIPLNTFSKFNIFIEITKNLPKEQKCSNGQQCAKKASNNTFIFNDLLHLALRLVSTARVGSAVAITPKRPHPADKHVHNDESSNGFISNVSVSANTAYQQTWRSRRGV